MHTTLVRLSLAALLLAVPACGGSDDDGGGGGPTGPQSGTINGTVTADGSGVAGVQVALGSASQTTNASGQFSFASVAAGSHTLTLTVPEDYELDAGQTAQKQVTVTAGQTASVTWALRRAALPTSVEVTMQASSFSPGDVTIAQGGTVRWVNGASIPHTVTPSNASQAGAWASQSIPAEQGYAFSHTFTDVGTFNYSCQIHAGMTGTVRVQ